MEIKFSNKTEPIQPSLSALISASFFVASFPLGNSTDVVAVFCGVTIFLMLFIEFELCKIVDWILEIAR